MSSEDEWEAYVNALRVALAAAERFSERVPGYVGAPERPRRAIDDTEAADWLALARDTEDAVRHHRLALEAFLRKP